MIAISLNDIQQYKPTYVASVTLTKMIVKNQRCLALIITGSLYYNCKFAFNHAHNDTNNKLITVIPT